MADDVTLSVGTADGAVIHTDDVGGVHTQINKLAIGALDTITLVTGGTGTVGAGTLRVTLATDVALPAGANAIGKLAANSGVDIGDVDITSIIPLTGATNLGKAQDGAVGATDTGVGMLAKQLATPANVAGSDGDYEFLQMSAGRLWVDASGKTLTVASHAVTNAGTFVVQATLDTETTKVIGTVRVASGGIASGSVASGAIASGAIASGAVASGAFAAGSIATGAIVDLVTEDVGEAGAEKMFLAGVVRRDVAASSSGATGDFSTANTDNLGKLWVTGGVIEDAAHVAAETLMGMGARRIDTLATSAGTSADWATVNGTAEGALWATLAPTTTSGLTTFMASGSDGSSILVATKQTIKASAGQLYWYHYHNPEATTIFWHIYNTDTVTVGTTNPQMSFAIPAGASGHVAIPQGISFSTAMSTAATTTAGGNTAPTTGLSIVLGYA